MLASRKIPCAPPVQRLVRRLLCSVWIFPIVLTFVLFVLTATKINGSSIGIYHEVLYGKTKDSNLIINHPQSIRSDEWIVNTQLSIAQYVAGYPKINPNIDSGRDMSVVGDAPYKEWSVAFKPQNLPFLILSFEYAFAFKWWFILYILIVSCYFFTLRIFKGRRLFASFFSLAIGFSPFFFWWYSPGVFMPVAYSFLAILFGIRIIHAEPAIFLKTKRRIYSQIIYALGLAYTLTSFALVLYPPFQIPLAIATAFFIAGLLLDKYGLGRKLISAPALKTYGIFLLGIIISGFLVLAFLRTRTGVIETITNTVYPGKRVVQQEGNSLYEIFSTFLQPQLQRGSKVAHYFSNQSEASNYILLLPFLFIPGFILLFAEYRKKRKVNWLLLSIQLCAVLFLAYLFIPAFGPLYSLLRLDKVANVRLFIGLGFIGVIQMLLIAKSVATIKFDRRKLNIIAGGYSLICLSILIVVGQYTRVKYPEFLDNLLFIVLLAVLFSAIIFCFMTGRALAGAALLLIFSLGSVFHIHPLYRGLGPVFNNAVVRSMDDVSKPGDSWAIMDSLYFENFALMANRDSLSGIKPYPDLAFWSKVEGRKSEYIYNRYAHVIFNDALEPSENLYLPQADNFQVRFGCYPFIETQAKYALAIHKLNLPCVSQIKDIHYPAVTFYLYRVNAP